jgi:MFS family permease
MLAGAFFLLRLCGQGLLGHTANTSMSRYFDKQRGKALSVAGLGYPAGEAILPSLVVAALASLGWRQTWYAVAISVAFVLVPLVIVLLRGHAERHAAHLAEIAERGKDSAHQLRAGRQWTRREVVKDLRFYLYLPAVMAPGFIVTGIFFHQGHLIESKGWTAPWFAACFIAFAAAQVLSSLIAGPLVDRFAAARIMPIFLVPLALSLVVLATGHSPATAALFLAMFGVTAGLGGPIVGAMWAEVYGTEHLGAIRAMATALMVFGTAGSPVLFGKLLDAGITIETICWGSCAYVLGAMILTTLALGVSSKTPDSRSA